jgi:pre-peptidase
MSKKLFNIRLILLFVVGATAASWAYAGGPLGVVDGQPVRWARREIRGGSLNSATVDGLGRVLYHVDSGTLGPLSQADATALVDRIFRMYTDVPTSTIEFVNAGRIMDPTTNAPVDVNASNWRRFASASSPTFQNPIIFDSDGSITGSGGVLGFFGFLQDDEATASLLEGFVVLNGRPLTNGSFTTEAFMGVFTHEFGHFAGPLDHSQINGNIALDGEGAILPPGFNSVQAFDLYAPFTETMFPFVYDAPPGSVLRSQFADSGVFIASLDLDTQNALSNLYPTSDYQNTRGSIGGRVLIRTSSGDIPVSGINVVARRIDQGVYPPPVGTTAYPSAISFDGGVPIDQPQAATDSLSTVSSAVTGLEFGSGTYRIQGLPPGQYIVEVQTIIPDATGGSGIGPLGSQIPLPVQEFYNGARESGDSGDSSSDFTPVTVTAAGVTTGIDIILNGFSSAPLAAVSEREPNEKVAKAQKLSFPVEMTAAAAQSDTSLLKMTLAPGVTDKIEDLYQFTVTSAGTFFILLEASSGAGDLDMYLFTSGVNKKKSSLNDPNLVDFSAGASSTEVIALSLPPGTYIIGVSAFDGSQGYKLRLIPPQ